MEFLITYILAMLSCRALALRVLPASYLTKGRFLSRRPVGTDSIERTPNEEQSLVDKLNTYQSTVKGLPMAEEVRTLIDQSLCYGVLSTNSVQFSGYPTGSVVGFELDKSGKPFFVFSTMSAHTKDILSDGRASLVVTAKDFKGAAEGRVTLIGNVQKVENDNEKTALRERYLARHKDAFWVDFGDFSYYAMNSVSAIRYVGGFARAGSVTVTEYTEAKPDPIAAFAAPVMKHMNEDHSDSTIAMVQHYVGIPCSEAEIISLDRVGMTVSS